MDITGLKWLQCQAPVYMKINFRFPQMAGNFLTS
jgi:hypothetical protein